MSVCRKLPDGTIQKIAGHTILLDANASEVRQGTWSLTGSLGGISTQITFTDPMPDNDYVVIVEPSADRNWGNPGPDPIGISNKTTTGFRLSSHTFTSVTTFTGTYTAFKPVKIEGYTELQNKINNPDNTPTIDSMNLVTSDGVARAIENASAVWKGTKAEWNALPATTKIKYDLAVLIDTQLIKSVDRTDGSDSDVADLTNVWTGTQAEWDAMTQAKKDKWDKAMIQDGYYGITPAVLPVGCVQAYMGSVEPPGWLLCNGQTFDQSVYPDLYNVLGINKVPDLRGEFLRGAGANPTTGYTGANVGVHQEGSVIEMFANYYAPSNQMAITADNSHTANVTDADKPHTENTHYALVGNAGTGNRTSGYSRPTNTSVNWIIFAGPAQ